MFRRVSLEMDFFLRHPSGTAKKQRGNRIRLRRGNKQPRNNNWTPSAVQGRARTTNPKTRVSIDKIVVVFDVYRTFKSVFTLNSVRRNVLKCKR